MRAARRALLELFLAERAGGGRLGGLFLDQAVLEFVHGLDEEEHDERDDQEIDDGADEGAEIDAVLGTRHGNGESRDLGAAARHQLDERVDDVVGQRCDDRGECAADDDADGHIHDIAFGDEFLELVHDLHGVLLSRFRFGNAGWQRNAGFVSPFASILVQASAR